LVLILTNCNVLNLEEGYFEENVDVVVRGNLIQRILKNGGINGEKIDTEGKYLLPGLFNMHNNLSMVFPFNRTNTKESPALTVLRCYRRAYDALISGITTLRTVGEMHRVDIHLRNSIKEGIVQGPRIFASGKGLGAYGGHGSDFGQTEAKGVSEFKKKAERELRLGADHLKIFITGGIAKKEEDFDLLQMSYDEMRAVVIEAKRFGTYVTAHAGGSKAITQAVRAGLECIEHGYVMDMDTAMLMKKKNVYLVPTLSVTRSPGWMEQNGFEEWTIRKAIEAKSAHTRSVRNAIRAGVRILVGTDLPPADFNEGVNATVKEMEFLSELGLSNLEIIRGATSYCAELCCRRGEKLGLLKAGYIADIVGTTKNPLKDIKALEKIDFVMKEGKVIV
jgi:imidazolonepropionase-like amidohydrolase